MIREAASWLVLLGIGLAVASLAHYCQAQPVPAVETAPTTTTTLTLPPYPPDYVIDGESYCENAPLECPCSPTEVPFIRGGGFQHGAWQRLLQTPLTATDALRVLIVATGGEVEYP